MAVEDNEGQKSAGSREITGSCGVAGTGNGTGNGNDTGPGAIGDVSVSQGGLVLQDIAIFRRSELLLKIDACIRPGEVLTLMGPSGSGKSTLISAIAGFLPAAFSCTGSIFLNGMNIADLPPQQRRIGVLFQDTLLFPHFSVLENILFAIPPGSSRSDRCERALALLGDMSLAEFADRDTATLSGGQKSRVALARVIASRPRALLLDEPFSKLDAHLRDSVRQLVFDEVRRTRVPTLLVTHDPEDAESAGGLILTL